MCFLGANQTPAGSFFGDGARCMPFCTRGEDTATHACRCFETVLVDPYLHPAEQARLFLRCKKECKEEEFGRKPWDNWPKKQSHLRLKRQASQCPRRPPQWAQPQGIELRPPPALGAVCLPPALNPAPSDCRSPNGVGFLRAPFSPWFKGKTKGQFDGVALF